MMGGHTGLKVLVYLFNFLLMLCGLALVVGGTIVQVHYNHYFHGMGIKFFVAPLLLIIAGCVMFLIAAFGCFGVCKLLPWTLILFASLLTIVFLLEISGVIAAYIERATVRQYIEAHMNASIGDAGTRTPRTEEQAKLWDFVQHDFKCCGVKSYADWPTTIPDSCCREDIRKPGCANKRADIIRNCEAEIRNNCPINTKGCLVVAEDYLSQNIGAIGGIGLGVAAFQILGIVLAACLAKRIRNDALNP
ncbi:CD63 antigen-like [Paramacrobiotus metropolitanus]|uniref:CD63 antigen-like n=1 Tax=Paramacrobiotus metropolitanus TaxID=2943436 RepID=UPI002445D308|nr:CD63 antigen-like [Paramacrobiotus metropolitanus]